MTADQFGPRVTAARAEGSGRAGHAEGERCETASLGSTDIPTAVGRTRLRRIG